MKTPNNLLASLATLGCYQYLNRRLFHLTQFNLMDVVTILNTFFYLLLEEGEQVKPVFLKKRDSGPSSQNNEEVGVAHKSQQTLYPLAK